MEPRIVGKPQIILVGTVQGAPDVGEIDIAALWQSFGARSGGIEHEVQGAGYELHVQTDTEPSSHYCMTGVEVERIGDMALDLFVKVLPLCTYAVFTHRLVDGYAAVYERIRVWLSESDYEVAHPYDFQLYDSRFTSMDDPESEQDIYVPVKPSG